MVEETGRPEPAETPKPPSKGRLRAQALEQARRERKERDRANRFRLLGLPASWPEPMGRGSRATRPPGAAPPARAGQYSDLPGARPADDSEDPPPPAPGRSGWRRFFGLRTTVWLLAAVALFVVFGRNRAPSAPKLAANCVNPAVAVEPSPARAEGLVRYAIAGPSTGRYAVAVDATSLRRLPDGKYQALPAPGASGPVQAVAMGTIDGCHRTGSFAVHLPAGAHRVNLLRLTDPTGSVVASTPLTVTPK